jgi:hypothetical protein
MSPTFQAAKLLVRFNLYSIILKCTPFCPYFCKFHIDNYIERIGFFEKIFLYNKSG